MAKSTFLDFSTTAGDNTDCGGIGIQGTNSVSNFDNAFRTLMAILRRDLDNGTVFVTKSGDYTAVANDNNAFYEFTAAATLSLTAAATLAADWHITVFANGGDVTIDPDSSETINGEATLVVSDGDAAYIICTGSAFVAITIPGVAGVAKLDTVNTFTKTQVWSKGADVASAAALTLGDDGNYFDVTGTTAITSIATVGVGTVIKLHFDGALTLTHHSTGLVLPGGADIATAAGDEAELVEYAAGQWRCVNYQRATGKVLVQTGWEIIGDPIRTASGVASVDITDLGAFEKIRITGKLFSANDNVNIQVRTSTDNGSNFAAGSGDYTNQVIHSSASTTTSAAVSGASGTGVYLASVSGMGNDSNEAMQFEIEIEAFNRAEYAFFDVSSGYVSNAGALVKLASSAVRANSAARNALRIIASVGNIASIRYTVEGIRG